MSLQDQEKICSWFKKELNFRNYIAEIMHKNKLGIIGIKFYRNEKSEAVLTEKKCPQSVHGLQIHTEKDLKKWHSAMNQPLEIIKKS